MANTQRPGFIPAQTTGTDYVTRRWPVASSASRIRKGDALVWGTASMALSASAATAVAGAATGVSYTNTDGDRVDAPNLPGSLTYSGTTVFPEDGFFVDVPDDVNTIYVASCDDAIANTDLNINYQMVLGSTTTRYSDHELDATSRGTTATLPWRVIGFVEGPTALSDPDIADAAVYCQVNAGFTAPALTVTGTA